jgi:hypothetical protein
MLKKSFMSVKLGIVKAADRLLISILLRCLTMEDLKKVEYETYCLKLKRQKRSIKN